METNWQRGRVTGLSNRTAILALLLVGTFLSLVSSHLLYSTVAADGWVPHNSGTSLDLYGVWGDSSSAVFACGDKGTVVHFDGNEWNSLPAGIDTALNGIWGESSTNVFVVGDNDIILRYDGTGWNPMGSGTERHWNAVWGWSTDNVFAAGTEGAILRYDGTSWSPMISGVLNTLYGVWGSSPTNVLVVGDSGTILLYEDASWTQMSSNTTSNLWGIWGSSASDVFAVGDSGCILHYDGSNWAQMSSGVVEHLYCVWGTSSDDVFAAGANGAVLHYNGIAWGQMTTTSDQRIRSMWGSSATNVFAVGDSGTILRYAESPIVYSVSPDHANQGDNVTVTIAGNKFIEPLTISFGDGISIEDFSVDTLTQITANITITAGAVAGARDVTVTNPHGTGVLSGGFTVQATNHPPVATGDWYVTDEDQPLEVPAPGVLDNDLDSDSDSLVAILTTGPSNGTLDFHEDGSFTYTPTPDFYGQDSFTYQAYDGAAYSGNATVTITINPVNDVPVALADSYSQYEDATLNVAAPGVLANDTDVDGDTLSSLLEGNVSHGTLTLASDGSFTYTPNPDFHGTDSFSYRSYDGEAYSNIVTVTITVIPVNDAPVAINDSYSMNEDATLTVAAPGVLGNDSDIDSGSLSTVLKEYPSYGTLTLLDDGSFVYSPDPDFHGTDGFSYQAFDGALYSDTAVVHITISAVNDAPVAVADSYTVNEDATLSVTAPGVLANDTDLDGNALSAIQVTDVAHGSLALASDGSFTYTPNPDFHGTDFFSYRSYDGEDYSNIVTVTITVLPVNDAPVARDMSYVTLMGRTLEIPSPGVLENDTDIDGGLLTADLESDVSHGTLVLNPDGSFTYTPETGFSGTDSFSYHAFDGSLYSNAATVTLTVNWFNAAPVASDDVYVIDEDSVLSVSRPGVLGNDVDADGNILTAILVSGPGNGVLILNANGSFTYTPNADFYGTDLFTYQASDSFVRSEPATVTIVIDPINDAPRASQETFSVLEDATLHVDAPGVLANDSDIDGDALKAVLVSTTSRGTLVLNSDGSFVYAPQPDFVGIDGFAYRAYDGSLHSDVINITIQVNRGPPMVFAVSPSEGIAGQAVHITISGANFSGATSLSLGPGIEVTAFWTESDELVIAKVLIDPGATGGARDVTVVTSAGTATLSAAFKVNLPQPTISGTDPSSSPRGQTVEVTLLGDYLLGAMSVSFGPGIAVNSYQVTSPQELTVCISIGPEALPGLREVTVSTPGGTAILSDGFEVTIPPPIVSGLSLDSVKRGQTHEIVINGENLDGASEIDLGEGVTVKTFYLDGSTRIVATVNIADDASAGPRDVSVATLAGTATLPGAFTVDWTLNRSPVWLWLGIGMIVMMMLAFFLLVTRRRASRKWTLLDLVDRNQH